MFTVQYCSRKEGERERTSAKPLALTRFVVYLYLIPRSSNFFTALRHSVIDGNAFTRCVWSMLRYNYCCCFFFLPFSASQAMTLQWNEHEERATPATRRTRENATHSERDIFLLNLPYWLYFIRYTCVLHTVFLSLMKTSCSSPSLVYNKGSLFSLAAWWRWNNHTVPLLGTLNSLFYALFFSSSPKFFVFFRHLLFVTLCATLTLQSCP